MPFVNDHLLVRLHAFDSLVDEVSMVCEDGGRLRISRPDLLQGHGYVGSRGQRRKLEADLGALKVKTLFCHFVSQCSTPLANK